MKLHALNERIVNYGFPLEIEDKDEEFHGHSRGILFAITDMSGNVLKNHMPDGSDDSLKKLLADPCITKLDQTFFSKTTEDDEEPVAERIGYYLPYYVVGHSMFMPTLNYDNIIDDGEHENFVDLELILACNGMNRYITAHLNTVNVSIMSALYESFNGPQSEKFLESLGFKSFSYGGFSIDVYNEIGECDGLYFADAEAVRDAIISVRIIGLKWGRKNAL